jgi:hypothetical protein
MTFHVFSFLLLFFLMHSLAWLCRLYLLHHGLAHSKAGAVHPMIQRLLKPRTPHDCPACCLSSPFSTVAGPTPLPVRPWPEVKSRRGAPKRIDTEGFACPNQQCAYFGISDAHVHAAFWRWQAWPGRGHPDVSRSCLPCHVHLQAQHSLVPSENPSQQIAMVLSALGSWARPIGRRAGLRLPTSHHHHPAHSRS